MFLGVFFSLVSDPPTEVIARVNSSTSVIVEWSPPIHPKGVILHYRVSWILVKDDNNKSAVNQSINNKTLPATARTYTIHDLRKYKSYAR